MIKEQMFKQNNMIVYLKINSLQNNKNLIKIKLAFRILYKRKICCKNKLMIHNSKFL